MAAAPLPLRLLCLFLLLCSVSAGAEEGEALLRFKAVLESAVLQSWIPGPAPCLLNLTSWEGVICFEGRVRGIQLENRGLEGRLDLRPLLPLGGLRAISFAGNQFSGPLPDIRTLGALKAIFLSGNNFSGEIQGDAFSGMRSLKKVFLSGNAFSGPIPASLGSLPRLMEVRLDRNGFNGGIPEFSQTGLKVFNVSFNNLQGAIPESLSKMDPAFFQGNGMLCGAPLAVACKAKVSRGAAIWIVSVFLLFFFLLFVFLLLCRYQRKKVAGLHPSKAAALSEENGLKPEMETARKGGGKESEQGRLVFVQDSGERFELRDLLRASAEMLGSGNFGSSYKAVLSAGPTVVVKRFREMNRVGREEFNEHMRRLGRLSHPNLLPLLSYYYKREEKLLITRFVADGSLAHMLHGNRGSTLPPLDWPTRLKIAKGVARGLAYLYDELPMLNLPHGHLKSSNVLLDETMDPLLTDYALVPVMNVSHAAEVMVAYKSPEVAQFGRPSKKCDVWSLGILIVELLTGKFPANFLHRGSSGSDFAGWVSSVTQEESTGELFDCGMGETADVEAEMRKLLKIGIDCCEENTDRRVDMREALERIEQLQEREG